MENGNSKGTENRHSGKGEGCLERKKREKQEKQEKQKSRLAGFLMMGAAVLALTALLMKACNLPAGGRHFQLYAAYDA